MRHTPQDLITGRMTTGVVHLFEAIQIDQEKRSGALDMPVALDTFIQAALELKAVREAGKRIVRGPMTELAIPGHALSRVMQHYDHAAHRALRVVDGRCGIDYVARRSVRSVQETSVRTLHGLASREA